MKEEWRTIPSFPIYEASSFGGIRSKFRVLSQWLDAKGYRSVTLYREGGIRMTVRVHVAVCEAFHGPKPAWAHHAAHNNGRKLINRPSNIRWTTALGNAADKKLHGTECEGERHHRSLFTEPQIKTIRAQYRAAPKVETVTRLAEAFMVSRHTIRNILNRKTWKHV